MALVDLFAARLPSLGYDVVRCDADSLKLVSAVNLALHQMVLPKWRNAEHLVVGRSQTIDQILDVCAKWVGAPFVSELNQGKINAGEIGTYRGATVWRYRNAYKNLPADLEPGELLVVMADTSPGPVPALGSLNLGRWDKPLRMIRILQDGHMPDNGFLPRPPRLDAVLWLKVKSDALTQLRQLEDLDGHI